MKKFFQENFGFTPRERGIIILIIVAIAVGSLLMLQSRISKNADFSKIYDYSPSDSLFQAKVTSVDTSNFFSEGEQRIINSLSEEDFTNVSGIGPVLARRIIDFRRKNGEFRSMQDLLEIPGIGSKKAGAIREYLIELAGK